MQGPIWESASFPPDTGSNTYLFVAVLFFVDKNLRDRAPRVWGDLNVTCDSNSGCPLEGNQYGMTRAMVPFYSGDITVMEVSLQRIIDGRSHSDCEYSNLAQTSYGPRHWPRLAGECYLLGYWEEHWLKDCSRYDVLIDSLEKLYEVGAWSAPKVRCGGERQAIEALFGYYRSSGESTMIDNWESMMIDSKQGVHWNLAGTEWNLQCLYWQEPSLHWRDLTLLPA